MSVARLGYLGFKASDPDAWNSFANNTLGMMSAAKGKDSDRYRIDSRAWRLAVHQGEQDDIGYAGFEVADAAAFSETAERLRQMGCDVMDESDDLKADRGVIGLVSTIDPSGVRIEIYYGGTELYELPFVSPVGVSSFMTGDQGLGHFVLATPYLEQSMKFYVEGLGMELSDIIDWDLGPGGKHKLHFFNCNRRHHTLALLPVPALPPKLLHHFMLEVGSLDDVGRANDRMERDSRIMITFGRHTNDHMCSFYGVTPSGFAVEVGYAPRDVDRTWSVVRYDSISMWGHKFIPPE
ncbi:VOC family protein [Sphingorhabdus sp. YGSMI21]|uniref:VOC family protein n=1 Tax=Sphingorhabdus sp. YGSMI21 TaxID=2077182 RepID=UPI000C1F5C1D|nr:VOC family protein [Sphingorhabdus sp. YGSMI21]ATW05268.1 2,3-dihydroxybiphenyl 1,2-dioxygenase [Sphingorhabdus sp. YGSMI21]